MDELFGTEEKKRNIIVFIFLIIFASIVSYIYIMFNTSSKLENAKGILR